MALIYIKRRREPIEVSNERARRIKHLRFGNMDGEGRADPTELIDLGDEWAGELGQITAIELTKDKPKVEVPKSHADEQREWEHGQLRLPIEERAKTPLYKFKMSWWMRSGMKEKEPPKQVLEYAYVLSLGWFEKHPREAMLPSAVLEDLLVKHWGPRKERGASGTLGEQKKLSTE